MGNLATSEDPNPFREDPHHHRGLQCGGTPADMGGQRPRTPGPRPESFVCPQVPHNDYVHRRLHLGHDAGLCLAPRAVAVLRTHRGHDHGERGQPRA